MNDYLKDGRFHIPDDSLLDTDDVKRAIKRRVFDYKLPPKVHRILHSPHTKGDTRSARREGGGPGRDGKTKPPSHTDADLKKSHKFFRFVIQKNGIHKNGIPKVMFDDTTEECAKYVFTGSCKNDKCPRAPSHVLPTGERKKALLKYASECKARYDASKGPNDPDFP